MRHENSTLASIVFGLFWYMDGIDFTQGRSLEIGSLGFGDYGTETWDGQDSLSGWHLENWTILGLVNI